MGEENFYFIQKMAIPNTLSLVTYFGADWRLAFAFVSQYMLDPAWHSGKGLQFSWNTICVCVWLPAGVMLQNHTKKRAQPLLLSDIRLQWEPDVISDDMKLMYMALMAYFERSRD